MFIHIYLVFYVTLRLAHGYKCGDCNCIAWMNTLSCSGKNISSFPAIEDPTWITHIDVLSTSVRSVKELHSWMQYFTADIRDNILLPCEEVLDLQRGKENALILTDCDDNRHPFTLTPLVQLSHPTTDWLNLLGLIPLVSIIGLAAYTKNRFSAILKGSIKTSTYAEGAQMTNVSTPRVLESLV